MPETWAEKAEREMKAGREHRRAESAGTWAERAEHEQRAETLERRSMTTELDRATLAAALTPGAEEVTVSAAALHRALDELRSLQLQRQTVLVLVERAEQAPAYLPKVVPASVLRGAIGGSVVYRTR